MTPLEDKLKAFDLYSYDAVRDLIGILSMHAEHVVAIARGRHVEGHYRYGDGNLKEWDDGELLANLMQELADAVVYGAERRNRASG